jgi:hypothetical protein
MRRPRPGGERRAFDGPDAPKNVRFAGLSR